MHFIVMAMATKESEAVAAEARSVCRDAEVQRGAREGRYPSRRRGARPDLEESAREVQRGRAWAPADANGVQRRAI